MEHYSAVERLESAAPTVGAPPARGARFAPLRAAVVVAAGLALVAAAQVVRPARPPVAEEAAAVAVAVADEEVAEGAAGYYIDASLAAYSYSYATAATEADDGGDDGGAESADDDGGDDDDDDWFGCFPGSATVLVDGVATPLRAARRGDRVLTDGPGGLAYAKIALWTHADDGAVSGAPFVTLGLASGANVTLTRGHYVPTANRGVVEARAVRVGDALRRVALDGGVASSAVVAVSRARARGLFAPVTGRGFVVVDGVVASEFSRGVARLPAGLAQPLYGAAVRAALAVLPDAALAAVDAWTRRGGVRGAAARLLAWGGGRSKGS